MGNGQYMTPQALVAKAVEAAKEKNWQAAGNFYEKAAEMFRQQGNTAMAQQCQGEALSSYSKGLGFYSAEKTKNDPLAQKCSDGIDRLTKAEAGEKVVGLSVKDRILQSVKMGSTEDAKELGRFIKQITDDQNYWIWKRAGGKELRKEMEKMAEELIAGRRPLLNDRQFGSVLTMLFENPKKVGMDALPNIFRTAILEANSPDEIVQLMQRYIPEKQFAEFANFHLTVGNTVLEEMEALLPAEARAGFRTAMDEAMRASKSMKKAVEEFMATPALADDVKIALRGYIETNPGALSQLELSVSFARSIKPGAELPPLKFRVRAWEKMKATWKTPKGKVIGYGLLAYGLYNLVDVVLPADWCLPGTLIPCKTKVETPEWFEKSMLDPKKFLELVGKMREDGHPDGTTRIQNEETGVEDLEKGATLIWKYRAYFKEGIVDKAFERLLATPTGLKDLNFEEMEGLLKRVGQELSKEAGKTDVDYKRVTRLLELAEQVNKEIKGRKYTTDALALMGDGAAKVFARLDYAKLLDLRKVIERQIGESRASTFELLGVATEAREKLEAGLAAQATGIKKLIDAEIGRRIKQFEVEKPETATWMATWGVKEDKKEELVGYILSGDTHVLAPDEAALMDGRLKPTDAKYKKTFEGLVTKLSGMGFLEWQQMEAFREADADTQGAFKTLAKGMEFQQVVAIQASGMTLKEWVSVTKEGIRQKELTALGKELGAELAPKLIILVETLNTFKNDAVNKFLTELNAYQKAQKAPPPAVKPKKSGGARR